jgi:Nucleotidyl transferase AbiEii toxin, Type IV TA system
VFERTHHRRIAQVLTLLDGDALRKQQCWFGGGTACALLYGEYRESVDVDFLVSDVGCYRALRQLLTGPRGVLELMSPEQELVVQIKDVRADQYGIRTSVSVDEIPIKFEVVLEGRIKLEPPKGDRRVCGISSLSPRDLIATKLLANSDRWADDGVFQRDVLDMAMMRPDLNLLRQGVAQAQDAYGEAIIRDALRARGSDG